MSSCARYPEALGQPPRRRGDRHVGGQQLRGRVDSLGMCG